MDKHKLPWLLPIRSVLFLLIFVIGAALTGKAVEDITNWWTVVVTVVNVITIALLVITAKRSGITYKELINYKKGVTKIRQVIGMIVIVFLLGMGFMYLTAFLLYGTVMPEPAVKMAAPIPAVLAVINFLLFPVTVPFAEDGLYLGYGVNRIKNDKLAVIISAFFFAVQHCFIPVFFDVRYILYRFFAFLPLTLVLCWHYRKHRNPLPIMIAHGLIDMSMSVMVLVMSLSPALYESMINA